MLFSPGSLYCRIHLARHAQIGKSQKTGISPHIIIPQRLKQPDHPLLNQIFTVRPQNIHGLRFAAYQIFIFVHQKIRDTRFPVPQPYNQFFVAASGIILLHLPSSFSHSLAHDFIGQYPGCH